MEAKMRANSKMTVTVAMVTLLALLAAPTFAFVIACIAASFIGAAAVFVLAAVVSGIFDAIGHRALPSGPVVAKY
jgi:hypothetical protein